MHIYQNIRFTFLSLFVLLCLLSPLIYSSDEWVVNDIRISGLQRVSAGSVFSVMPLSVGDKADEYSLLDVSKSLFSTGQFDDIQLGREGDTLIVNVKAMAIGMTNIIVLS